MRLTNNFYINNAETVTPFLEKILSVFNRTDIKTVEKAEEFFQENWFHSDAKFADKGLKTPGYEWLTLAMAHDYLKTVYDSTSPTRAATLPSPSVKVAVSLLGVANTVDKKCRTIETALKTHHLPLEQLFFIGFNQSDVDEGYQVVRKHVFPDVSVEFHNCAAENDFTVNTLKYAYEHGLITHNQPFTVVLTEIGVAKIGDAAARALPPEIAQQFAGALCVPELDYTKDLEGFGFQRFGEDAVRVMAMAELNFVARAVHEAFLSRETSLKAL